jgi:uncharacterized membrane protein
MTKPLTIQELIELDRKTSAILGWKGGGSIDIQYDLNVVNDIVIYTEVHPDALIGSLLPTLTTIYQQLESLWGEKALNIEFITEATEDEKIKYTCVIELAERCEEEKK